MTVVFATPKVHVFVCMCACVGVRRTVRMLPLVKRLFKLLSDKVIHVLLLKTKSLHAT